MSLRSALVGHLGSPSAARVIYGAIIGLALVLALQLHPPDSGRIAAAVIATAIAVGLAEAYSEIVGAEARNRRRVTRADVRLIAPEVVAVVAGAGLPAVWFVLAGLGAFERDTAFAIATWTGLGLICGYGFLAARLAGSGLVGALCRAVVLGTIAGALIVVKALLH